MTSSFGSASIIAAIGAQFAAGGDAAHMFGANARQKGLPCHRPRNSGAS
jgi:hypothetical protein